jgi:hypothetical protein
VIFNDPLEEIPDPVGCSGTLAVGGFCTRSPGGTKTFSGTVFTRAVRGLVTFADNYGSCESWTPCNVAEVAAHEVGHTIGFDHTSEDPSETDPILRDALMYFLAHFDGRCAELRSDDVAGLSFIYPTAIPPTITTPDPLPGAVVSAPYSQTLTAVGGAGGFSWGFASGSSFPGLTVSPDGVLSGTPQAFTEEPFPLRIKATDTNGDSHTKVLNITVSLTAESPTPTHSPTPTLSGTPTATQTRSATPTRSATGTATPTATTGLQTPIDTPTPTPTSVAAACVGDCNGNQSVTVDELVTGVNIALGSTPVTACPAFDTNLDTRVTVDELVTAVNNALQGCQVT